MAGPGNAVFFNGYSRWCNLSRNEVRYPGESAFVAVGRTAKFDATGGDYPQDNTIEYNHLHELGVYTKQTAGYFQSQAAHNHLKGNLIYNVSQDPKRGRPSRRRRRHRLGDRMQLLTPNHLASTRARGAG